MQRYLCNVIKKIHFAVFKKKRKKNKKTWRQSISENNKKRAGNPNFRLRMHAQEPTSGSRDWLTTGEKAQLGRILRKFRLRMCAPFQWTPFGHFR